MAIASARRPAREQNLGQRAKVRLGMFSSMLIRFPRHIQSREIRDRYLITCDLGLALDDMAVAPLLYRRAVEKGIGTRLPL